MHNPSDAHRQDGSAAKPCSALSNFRSCCPIDTSRFTSDISGSDSKVIFSIPKEAVIAYLSDSSAGAIAAICYCFYPASDSELLSIFQGIILCFFERAWCSEVACGQFYVSNFQTLVSRIMPHQILMGLFLNLSGIIWQDRASFFPTAVRVVFTQVSS